MAGNNTSPSPIANAVAQRARLSQTRQRVGLEGGQSSQLRELAPSSPNGPDMSRTNPAAQAVAPAQQQGGGQERLLDMAREFIDRYRPQPQQVQAQPPVQTAPAPQQAPPPPPPSAPPPQVQAPGRVDPERRQRAMTILSTLEQRLGRRPTPDEIRLYLEAPPR